jgi:hypothetical protein
VHHNLAVRAAPVAFPHHIAFDIDDVVRGGRHMVDIDPDPAEFLEPTELAALIAAG